MVLKIGGVRVAGICAAIPENEVAANEFPGISEREVQRLIRSTGFSRFRLAGGGKKASDYSAAAAEALFRQLGISADTVDAIVFVSQTPDNVAPATSAILQARLGIREEAMIFDINHGCPGFVYGIFQASMLVQSGLRRVLLCAGDTASQYVDPGDRSTRFVFGDGAAAAIVERGKEEFAFSFYTDGSQYRTIWVPMGGPISMNGADIMTFSLKVVPPMLQNFLQELGVDKEKVDIFAMHQANRLILATLAKKMQVPQEKMPFGAENFGNTSMASIPLLLATLYGGKPVDALPERAVLCGFGIGLSVAAVLLPLRDTQIMRYIEL